MNKLVTYSNEMNTLENSKILTMTVIRHQISPNITQWAELLSSEEANYLQMSNHSFFVLGFYFVSSQLM